MSTQLQLPNTSVSISITDEHTKEGIMGIIRVDHVLENRGLKNKIWKNLERKSMFALILSKYFSREDEQNYDSVRSLVTFMFIPCILYNKCFIYQHKHK